MNDVKGLLQSKTVWGCVVTILCMILMQFGIEVDEGSKSELVNAFVTLGGVGASLFAIYGRVKADKKVEVKKGCAKQKANLMILFMLMTPIMVSACAFKSLPPDQQALGAGEELRLQYLNLHDEYLSIYNNKTTSPELKQKMETKVAPVMNATKKAVILYRDAAYIYAAYKKKPDNYDRLKKAAQDAFRDAAALMFALTTEPDGSD